MAEQSYTRKQLAYLLGMSVRHLDRLRQRVLTAQVDENSGQVSFLESSVRRYLIEERHHDESIVDDTILPRMRLGLRTFIYGRPNLMQELRQIMQEQRECYAEYDDLSDIPDDIREIIREQEVKILINMGRVGLIHRYCLTDAQLAEFYGKHRSTLYRMRKNGIITDWLRKSGPCFALDGRRLIYWL